MFSYYHYSLIVYILLVVNDFKFTPLELNMSTIFFSNSPWADKGVGEGVTWASAIALAPKHNILLQWDELSKTPQFTYIDGGVQHTVCYENTRSLEMKLAIAKKYGIYGVCFWRLGNEDPDNKALLNKLS